ncbi:MAG: segregation/condensation protein A [Candidatus Micrarchaeia archaeon]
MDLLKIIAKPTWREFLVDLVAREEMDPWDIDLVQVADKYLASVRNLQAMDLRLPANVILASALLLRFKAEALKLDWSNLDEPTEGEETRALLQEELPELVLKPNRPRQRGVTLDELIGAMNEVMRRGRRLPRHNVKPAVLQVELPENTMDERMTEVLERATGLKDAEDVLLFSALLHDSSMDEVAAHLLPIMHLVQTERMHAWQDDTFGEIFLRVLPGQSEQSA